METHEEVGRQTKQMEAEVDVLQLLWSGTVKSFTPERWRFNRWLRVIGYVETIHCINQTIRVFIRCHGLMFPSQLIRCMENAVRHTAELQRAEESRGRAN